MDHLIAQWGRVILGGGALDRKGALDIVAAARCVPHDLFYWANRVRQAHFGNSVRLCSIIAGKLGACAEDCKWCAQSLAWMKGGSQTVSHPPRQGLEKPQCAGVEEILSATSQAATRGATCMGIVNSGRRPGPRDIETVTAAARSISSQPDASIRISASLGEITEDQARQLASAGVHRYHHNLETSRRMFGQMVSTHSYDDRLATLVAARSAGMSVCSGGIFGIGENWEDRIDLALTLRDQVRPDTVPINFLSPIPGTPLENTPPLEPMELLTIVAMFRLILPRCDIKVAGGRQANLRDLQSWMFYAGASGCMVGNYLTTSGREVEQDLQMIRDLGLDVMQ